MDKQSDGSEFANAFDSTSIEFPNSEDLRSSPNKVSLFDQGEIRSAIRKIRLALPGYEIFDEVSRGGQGVVYRAIQLSTKQQVAIKTLNEGAYADTSDLLRFKREIRLLAQLKHPNIVPIHDAHEADGQLYFVMDYISGVTIDLFVRATPDKDQLIRVFVKVCEAVQAAHVRGIVHRDLKPGNILIDSKGEPRILCSVSKQVGHSAVRDW